MVNLRKTFDDMQELAASMQPMFAAIPVTDVQSAHFWQAQDTFLKEFEKYSAAWYTRRHEGTKTAMDVSKHLADHTTGDPTAAMQALVDWQTRAMERLAADTKDYMELMANCAAAAVANEAEAVEESVAVAKRATKSSKSDPV